MNPMLLYGDMNVMDLVILILFIMQIQTISLN